MRTINVGSVKEGDAFEECLGDNGYPLFLRDWRVVMPGETKAAIAQPGDLKMNK